MKPFIAKVISGRRITIPEDVAEKLHIKKGIWLRVEIIEVLK